MRLSAKFNLVLGLTSLAGIAGSAFFSYHLLQANAREEVLNTARLMMESALAVRSYTTDEIKPLLVEQQTLKFLPPVVLKRVIAMTKHNPQELQFLPQTVPAYSANQFIAKLHKKHPEYSYKEAALNPTNPANRTADWEADIVTWFKNNEDKTELVGERDSATERILYLSHPIKITNPSCLTCHSTPAVAPKNMLSKYGDANGFGWKMNEIIGAQIVSVPMTLPLQRAETAFFSSLGIIVAIFVIVGILLNILLYFIVIKPIMTISKQADKVSMGELEIAELAIKGNDEVSSASQSFNRMHRSLVNAFKMLEDDND